MQSLLYRICQSSLVVTAILLLAGCGSSNGMVNIAGTVTFDGEPVQNGSITFMPIEGGTMGGGLIENGRIIAESPPGKMAVQIHGQKIVKVENPSKEQIERGLTEDRVPLKIPTVYNTASKLRVTISPDQKTFDFNLTKDGKIPEGMSGQ
ncbi:hypothetical protein GC197_18185 [bacterium]|nr:hypothetical protein [bacterium]